MCVLCVSLHACHIWKPARTPEVLSLYRASPVALSSVRLYRRHTHLALEGGHLRVLVLFLQLVRLWRGKRSTHTRSDYLTAAPVADDSTSTNTTTEAALLLLGIMR